MAYYKLNKSQKFLGRLFSLVKSFPKVYASLWSVQNKRSLDALHPFKNTLASVKDLEGTALNHLQAFWKKLDQKLYLSHMQQNENFTFCKQNRFSFLAVGALLSFNHNNRSMSSHGSETKFRTKFFAKKLSFKKAWLF